MFINFVMIDGRLTQKPEIQFTKNGKKTTSFSLCYNQVYKVDEEFKSIPHFFKIVAWEKVAEKVQELNKGDAVSVIGSLRYKEWEKDGKKNSLIEILAKEIRLISKNSKKDQNESLQADIQETSAFFTEEESDMMMTDFNKLIM